jgi:hypothetical protein
MQLSLLIRLVLLTAIVATSVPGASLASAPAAPCQCCEHAGGGTAAGECCTMTPATPDHHAVLTSPPARRELVPIARAGLLGDSFHPRHHHPPTEWRPPGNGRRTYLHISVLRI